MRLKLVVVVGVQVGGRALPTIFPMQYTTQSGALAGRRQLSLPYFFFFPSFLHFLPFHPTFLPLSQKKRCPPLFSPSSCFPPSLLFLSSSCCPSFLAHSQGKQTITFGNDPPPDVCSVTPKQVQILFLFLPCFCHFQCRLQTTVQGLR